MDQEMTGAYMAGFLTKCAEYGLPGYVAEYMLDQLNKKAASKPMSSDKLKKLFGMENLQHAKEMQKTSGAIDFSKLFPSSKFHTEDELKAKEATFSVGDRVKVVDNIRCRQKGKTGTLVETPKGMDEKTGAGYRLFYVKFDDEKYGTVGFQSGDIDKV